MTILLSLSKSRQIRLVIPEVVLRELSRHWREKLQNEVDKVNCSIKHLNEFLMQIKSEPAAFEMIEPDRSSYYDYAKTLFLDHCVEVSEVPEVSTEAILTRDLEVRKPFNRNGKGFRDTLIWENIREICNGLQEPGPQVVFVTNNSGDFCEPHAGNLHSDLRQEIGEKVRFDIVVSLKKLLEHDAMAPLVSALGERATEYAAEQIARLIDRITPNLLGVDLEMTHRTYIGEGMYEPSVCIGLDNATLEDVEWDHSTVSYELFRADNDILTIRVRADARCRFDGFIEKSVLFLNSDEEYSGIEDWNDYCSRVSVDRDIRFTLSGSFVEGHIDDLVLSVDDIEEIFES